MSQAQQLAWLKEHRPEVYARAQEKAKTGQFLPTGSLWVEPDTNITGGESLARQFVHGKRFYLEEFGVETEEMWLPDTFGYNAALPQLMKLAGVRWFLTQKISWNTTNKFPHHTFWWEGIDGTRIFSHFPPVDTYNSELSGAEVAHSERNFQRQGGRRPLAGARSATATAAAAPPARCSPAPPGSADLEGSAAGRHRGAGRLLRAGARRVRRDAPVWVGELYLEFHRGTLTSQLATKQGNRRSEHLLREAELWAATAAVRTGAAYPYEALDRLWKTVLLHQFHDILPGTSIAWVHREAEETYAEVARELGELIGRAQRALAGPPDPDGGGVVFNAAPHARGGVPALGAAPRTRRPPRQRWPRSRRRTASCWTTAWSGCAIDGRGLITSAYDLTAGREALAPGRGRPTSSNSTRTSPTSGTPGTSTRSTATPSATSPRRTRSRAVDGGVRVVRTFGDSRDRAAPDPRAGTAAGSTSTP